MSTESSSGAGRRIDTDTEQGRGVRHEQEVQPDELALRLCRALVCAAVDPALCGVLLFDLEPQLLDPVARLFRRILAGAGRTEAPLVMLGASSRDEDLWTRAVLRQEADGIGFHLEPGPLIQADDRPEVLPPVVAVPDLCRLSVAGMRGAVQLLGADVAVVEHAGLSRTVRPRARWLAACGSAEAGRVGNHLLDRFAIRLPAAGLRLLDVERLLGSLPPDWLDRAARSVGGQDAPAVTVTDEVITRVARLLGPDTGVRRQLALARLARALAALQGDDTAGVAHCDEAARLMGLAAGDSPRQPVSAAGPPPPTPVPSRPVPRPRGDAVRRGQSDQHERRWAEAGQTLLESEPAEGVGSAPGGTPTVFATPYPEDRADVLRDFAPLRSPWQRTPGTAPQRGLVIGSRRARDLNDLAYVRTVREAAVHQRVRHAEGFTVSPADLHSHVRAGAPERLLVLVLDHTCRGDWDWQDMLTPYLQWAYTMRAAVQVVEVGGARSADELKAESLALRSVLDPRLLAALYRPPGRASPLAHGIEQAARALRRAFRQHGSGLAEAWLVVVTDGRGNVPLRASHTGRLSGPVGAEGVEDALTAAADIRGMDRTRLQTVVIDAGREPYGNLPSALADTLGGAVVEGYGGGRGHGSGRGPDTGRGGDAGEW
ncbi:magnesium chelatase [Streptomyces sp. LRE541]|uniref:magnesium chelatase n=1 Tax=Streptomyces sp. LRE541 TaxID=2931983 RepID=UPI00200E8249|nr:magnesium chelatase [Streptomyces sp. LRE541]UPZ28981.1 magnesium chelatase [Streptomyces sp. LRE541]